MYKKLEPDALQGLMEAGIDEFAENGLDRAAMNRIAKKAGLSVGVIYKYYKDKDDFFLSCVKYSLRLLEETMTQVAAEESDMMTCISNLIHTLVREAYRHPSYYKLYNEITSGSCKKYAKELADQIEASTAGIYEELIRRAQKEGRMDFAGDPKMTAFFFDNLLMMLQFSFSCDYYKHRMEIFCGEESLNQPEAIGEEMIRFIVQTLGGM
ncbi:MAG: TetR/AcrR family transcriptional regulator [Lachnospiraceae bacterium]|nr:TetR/AcrR family transcriptional regulator [Lachnospiraceae bacterium]